MRMSMRVLLRVLLFSLLVPALALAAADKPSPPAQPAEGPGGSDYAYDRISVSALGEGAEEVLLFEPAGAAGPRPVVVLLHGWGAVNPRTYGAWIEHLVRHGAVVLFPRYQADLRTLPDSMTESAARSLQLAFAQLGGRADRERVVFVGHSMGGIIAANLATLANGSAEAGFPVPRAVLAVQPGGAFVVIALADLAGLAPETLLITMAGEDDRLVGDNDALAMLEAASDLPAERKLFIEVPSDARGLPPLSANHVAPAASDVSYSFSPGRKTRPLHDAPAIIEAGPDKGPGGEDRTDALDYFAFWKTLDLVMEVAFDGGDAGTLLRDPRLIDMGQWSDGEPVQPMKARQP